MHNASEVLQKYSFDTDTPPCTHRTKWKYAIMTWDAPAKTASKTYCKFCQTVRLSVPYVLLLSREQNV